MDEKLLNFREGENHGADATWGKHQMPIVCFTGGKTSLTGRLQMGQPLRTRELEYFQV